MTQYTSEALPSFTHLKKAAQFTDIHFGRKGNSELHNQDCLGFVDWFCENVRNDPTIDHVIFTGDWHEHRSSLNILTMHYSYEAAKRLSKLGIPVFIMVGNHDLFHRQIRDIYSTLMFGNLPNIYMINQPVVLEFSKKVLMCPYLFQDEYPTLAKYLDLEVWWGHFEFKGFVLTGHNIKMQHGPDHLDFIGPKKIFSGHFHQRQISGNVVYTGSSFPMDFSDAGQYDRGMMVYDYDTDTMKFIDWEDCPKYVKAKLSAMLDDSVVIPRGARVKCVVDVPLTYEESLLVKQSYMKDYDLREINLEESDAINDAITNTDGLLEEEGSDLIVAGVDQLVVQMLGNIDTAQIDRDLLIKLYTDLRID